MTRTGLSPRLGAHLPEPFVEVHPDDAPNCGLSNGDFARLRSAHGACVLKVRVSDGQQRGSLFAPIHWSGDNCVVGAHRRSGRAGDRSVLRPAGSEGDAGQHRAGRIRRARLRCCRASRSRCRRTRGGPRGRQRRPRSLAGGRERNLLRGAIRAAAMFPGGAAEYIDEPRGLYRAALFVDGRLDGCLFIGPAAAPPQWDAMKVLFEAEHGEPHRRAVLSGKSTDGLADPGPVVCACFGVGANTIRTRDRSWRRQCRRDRQGAARRHQLRFVSAGIEKDRELMSDIAQTV